ncbi:hypothetical protein A2U01_0069049, partial [Trifolium medium]|nr:hypothetical protein [Trifolium medium]
MSTSLFPPFSSHKQIQIPESVPRMEEMHLKKAGQCPWSQHDSRLVPWREQLYLKLGEFRSP